MRFSEEPQGLVCHVVAQGSPADGATLRAIHHDRTRISMVTCDGRMLMLTGDTVLRAGDQI